MSMASLNNVRLRDKALPELTVCIIGRNESQNLPRCADSLLAMKDAEILYESIYVDSASSDQSVCVAKEHLDVVITLAESPDLNASAARAVGTEHAQGEWILYLDGDMILAPDFVPIIKKYLAQYNGAEGVAGRTLNRYPDGSSDFIVFHGNEDEKRCCAFGGAVMLKRDAVLQAGNWARNLYSNEEVELFSRLIKQNSQVFWTDVTMVEHVTEKFNTTGKFFGNFVPYRSFLGKKFYGAGQATRLSLSNGNFMFFVRLKLYQYLMTICLCISSILVVFNVHAPLVLLAMIFSFISLKRGGKFAINCVCWASQVFFGWRKFNPGFYPNVTGVYRRARVASISS
ncbi:MAG: glycosyltransferase family 2 protein [Sphingomonadaceae bacterium]|jgi:glycosyltransferase involved in cell wall biosynthesis